MKKVLTVLLMTTMMVLLTSCDINNKLILSNDTKDEIEYGSVESSYFVFFDARELIEGVDGYDEGSDVVLTGTVTGISFEVLDKVTGFSPSEGAKEYYNDVYGQEIEPWHIFEMVTVYDVDVIESYKGEIVGSAQVTICGGLRDVRVEEQLAVSHEYGLEYIYLYEEGKVPVINIGETYLFALVQPPSGRLIIKSPIQSIYSLNNPFEKNTINGHVSDDAYTRNADSTGAPLISAYDVISVFGEDKWDEFWTEWQRDNPDWDTWMDKAAVEKVLAES